VLPKKTAVGQRNACFCRRLSILGYDSVQFTPSPEAHAYPEFLKKTCRGTHVSRMTDHARRVRVHPQTGRHGLRLSTCAGLHACCFGVLCFRSASCASVLNRSHTPTPYDGVQKREAGRALWDSGHERQEPTCIGNGMDPSGTQQQKKKKNEKATGPFPTAENHRSVLPLAKRMQ
jgi:hypothetical protein